jgi:hypothetical protein
MELYKINTVYRYEYNLEDFNDINYKRLGLFLFSGSRNILLYIYNLYTICKFLYKYFTNKINLEQLYIFCINAHIYQLVLDRYHTDLSNTNF